MDDYMIVRGRSLKNARLRLHMTQRKMANKLAITQPALANYENAKRAAPVALLQQVEQMERK